MRENQQILRIIQRPNQESRQAFVAMWFNNDMKTAYDQAIEPAIEYLEPGESASRFKALRIDNKEHVNDINDQIIAEIRRSRFMVCDLTGHRGGVYFEAGFAYGLGIPVIYTCRNDWTKAETLRLTKEKQSEEIKHLYDSYGQAIRVGKEGVHFDLNHRNRIEWDPEDLEDFRIRLERRIKAVIY
jgi:nucleoside 2-deoxyribosyltransferase